MHVTEEPLLDADATAQAAAVAAGQVSVRELVQAALARIDERNPALNAVIHRFDEEALATEPAEGPFRGVPFLLKDCVAHSAGHPFHSGMQVLKDHGHTASTDSEYVRRVRAAGFVLVGKTNLPELATTCTTEPAAYGPTHNPWDLERSPGGSSGGSAAAVASRMVAVAHANDMGGSIRLPASVCGLVGLKPTRARTSLAPDFGEYWGPLTHEFVLVRSVRDAAGCLDALGGMAPGDPYTAPPNPQGRTWSTEVTAPVGRLRIGVLRGAPGLGDALHPDCSRALDDTAALLIELGHEVVESDAATLLDPDTGAGVAAVMCAAVARDLDRVGAIIGRPLTEDDVEPGNWMMATIGRATSAADYVAGLEQLQAGARRMGVAFAAGGFDALLTPTVPAPPFPLGLLGPEALKADPISVMGKAGGLCAFTIPFNATGQPAISLPLATGAGGLPIGMQFVAGYGREDVLLRLAAQLEQARPWDERRPAI